MKKTIVVFCAVIFLAVSALSSYAASDAAPEFLCETGIKFYREARYAEALHEFRKALMVNPTYKPAIKYIQIIEQIERADEDFEVGQGFVVPLAQEPVVSRSRADTVRAGLELIEIQKEMIRDRRAKPPLARALPAYEGAPIVSESPDAITKVASVARVLKLDASLASVPEPIEIEQGKTVAISGKTIRRFLVTEANILKVERTASNEIAVTGNDIGYTYLHIWDEQGRWTVEFLTVPYKPQGPTLEEEMRRSEEKSRNFKLRYSIDWFSYEKGRRVDSLKRSDYSYFHNFGLFGETPYGNLDSSFAVSRFTNRTDVGHITLGLTDGQLGQFKGFNVRGFDFFDNPPYFSNIAFSGIGLRGGVFDSPAFNNKFHYTVFQGRENPAAYGNLSPDLTKTKKSFLNGINLDYRPTAKQNYRFTLAHGWGSERENNLSSYTYDLINDWKSDKWKLGYEIANDSETFAHILNSRYSGEKLRAGLEARNISKNFLSITGSSWRQGELGGLFDLNYTPTAAVEIGSSLDVFRDRLYPAKDNTDRWNEDFTLNSVYKMDPSTSLRLNYILQNQLGSVLQYRYKSADAGVSRKFRFIKNIDTYFNYYHQDNENFSTPSSGYTNDRIYGGLKFDLIGQLYYYVNKEINWLNETYTGDHSVPNALETGLDWSDKIGNSPWRGTYRFTYRDEEDSASSLSFLSGEDYIENYSQLSYQPKPDFEAYGSCRMRNVWADKPEVAKRIEFSFNLGMRYLWDTGLSWQTAGDIAGYVFKDYNADGLRQRDEPPVEGIKVWLGKNKSQVTDIFGYYDFKGVRGRKGYVAIDTSTIPSGFILTVPAVQETPIGQGRTNILYFGIASRSEIYGFVFEDIDGNGEYDRADKGLRDVVVSLDGVTVRSTDGNGKYSFSRVSPGEHTITLDLNSLPVYYLPKVTKTKKITLFEGVTYNYNLPLKRNTQ